ncbi:MAG: hypothetical protein J7539_14335 [Niabella sp.]|nr:hypothetical protein [Niabella sp.]
MFGDYTKLILQDYETKKAAGLLPLNLSKPTPARLRDECLIVCKGRFERKDEKMLRDFFGQADNDTGYLRIIKKCAIDRFRPLINFLKKPTIRTDEKNVELLAWLIDWNRRPFQLDKRYDLNEQGEAFLIKNDPAEKIQIDEEQEITEAFDTLVNQENKMNAVINPGTAFAKPKYPLKPLAVFIIALLALAGIVIYQSGNGRLQYGMGNTLDNRGSCMYWTGDHYEQIPCNQKVYGVLVVALDSLKLLHFKKITQPDTLTEADINRVFYIKYNGKIEFYTGGGAHPVYTERSLKPLTAYIYEKYILPQRRQ